MNRISIRGIKQNFHFYFALGMNGFAFFATNIFFFPLYLESTIYDRFIFSLIVTAVALIMELILAIYLCIQHSLTKEKYEALGWDYDDYDLSSGMELFMRLCIFSLCNFYAYALSSNALSIYA